MSSQPNGFGPWSTALDNGTRLQLSAFWRQRMAGLARLPIGRRSSRRWLAVGICAAIALAASPLVEFSAQAVAKEKEESVAAKSPGKIAGEDFAWRFSNGLEVELIGIAKNPSKGTTWWRPDGTPAEEIDVPSALYQSDAASWELAFRWRKMPKDGEVTKTWHTKPSYSGAGGGVLKNGPDGSIIEVEGVSFDGDLKEVVVTFTASVASTPWKKAFETDGRNARSSGTVNEGEINNAAFTGAYETKTGVAITVSYGIGAHEGRVVLIDKSGKELLPTRQRGVGSTHFLQTTYEFDGVTLADIERFELQTQTRTLETVEFHNVSLEAGHATKVVIEPSKVDRRGAEAGYLPIETRAAIAAMDDQRIDRMPILGPITSGKEIVLLDPPSDDEILRAFNKTVAPSFLEQIGLLNKKELPLEEVAKIDKFKFEEKVDPSRVYPLIGEARQVHSLYICELELKDGKTHRLCVDHNHLHVPASEEEPDAQDAAESASAVKSSRTPATNNAEPAADDAEAMSLEEALKIVRPSTSTRYEAPLSEERRAYGRIALEHRKLFQELVDNGTFALKPGELVKFVPASESGETRRKLASLTEETRRVFLSVETTKNGEAEVTNWTMDDMSLMDSITSVLGLPIQNVDGRDQTLGQELPEGDWVCSWDPRERPPLDQPLVAAFEKTLSSALKEPIKLSLQENEVRVLVASGVYQANPIINETHSIPALSPEVAKQADGPFSFPARRGRTVQAVGDFPRLLDSVGALLLTPIVNEASPGPTKESYFVAFAAPPKVKLHEPLDEASQQAVIAAFEKQTALKLTPARRQMNILVVK